MPAIDRSPMYQVLGQNTKCRVSLRAGTDVQGELDENDLTVTPLEFLVPLLHELHLDVTAYQVVSGALQQAQKAFLTTKSCAEAFHESMAPLFPLTIQLTTEQAQKQVQWIHQRRSTLDAQLTSNPGDNPEPKGKYKNALYSMEFLMWLFSGVWVPNLIPDGCPTGFVCNRLEQLMQDLVMADFDGHYTSRAYSGEQGQHLPSDSTLLMFLMCIYLKVPGWNLDLFHADAARVRNGPLLLMGIDLLADPAYSAFLTSVPPQRHPTSHAFILRHKQWMPHVSESVVTLMLDGKLRANFGGISGFFEAMTVFLACHRLKFGNIGGVSFSIMQGLDWVFAEQSVRG